MNQATQSRKTVVGAERKVVVPMVQQEVGVVVVGGVAADVVGEEGSPTEDRRRVSDAGSS